MEEQNGLVKKEENKLCLFCNEVNAEYSMLKCGHGYCGRCVRDIYNWELQCKACNTDPKSDPNMDLYVNKKSILKWWNKYRFRFTCLQILLLIITSAFAADFYVSWHNNKGTIPCTDTKCSVQLNGPFCTATFANSNVTPCRVDYKFCLDSPLVNLVDCNVPSSGECPILYCEKHWKDRDKKLIPYGIFFGLLTFSCAIYIATYALVYMERHDSSSKNDYFY